MVTKEQIVSFVREINLKLNELSECLNELPYLSASAIQPAQPLDEGQYIAILNKSQRVVDNNSIVLTSEMLVNVVPPEAENGAYAWLSPGQKVCSTTCNCETVSRSNRNAGDKLGELALKLFADFTLLARPTDPTLASMHDNLASLLSLFPQKMVQADKDVTALPELQGSVSEAVADCKNFYMVHTEFLKSTDNTNIPPDLLSYAAELAKACEEYWNAVNTI